MDKRDFFETIMDYLAKNHPEVYMDAIDKCVTEDHLNDYFFNETFKPDKNVELFEKATEFLQSWGIRVEGEFEKGSGTQDD